MSTPFRHNSFTNAVKDFAPYFPSDPNQGYSWDQNLNNATAQSLYYETPIGKGIIDALTRYVVGAGLQPMASPETSILGWTEEEATRFAKQAESYFRLVTHSPNIDYYGKDNLNHLQKMAFRSLLIDGDVLLHRGFRKLRNNTVVPFIQIIPGNMVANPTGTQDTKNLIGGVSINAVTGKEDGYYIRSINEDLTDTNESVRVNRYTSSGFREFDLIKLHSSNAMLRRGIPLLSTAKVDILRIHKLKDTRLTKAIVEAILAFALEKQKDNPGEPSAREKLAELQGEQDDFNDNAEQIKIDSGTLIELNEGETLKTIESQNTSEDFSAMMKTYMEQALSSADGLSYELYLNSYNASYSAARATINGGEKAFRIWREEFVDKFLKPIWEMIISLGIDEGFIEAPRWLEGGLYKEAILASTWGGVTPIQVDPQKDVGAYVDAINNNLCTHERACQNLFGTDFEETIDRLNVEREQIGENGEEKDEENNDSTAGN